MLREALAAALSEIRSDLSCLRQKQAPPSWQVDYEACRPAADRILDGTWTTADLEDFWSATCFNHWPSVCGLADFKAVVFDEVIRLLPRSEQPSLF